MMTQATDVYVWDMDETLILLKSLINGTYAEALNGVKDVQRGLEIGNMWENHILEISDGSFFYEQIENYNMPHLDSLSQYDDGRDLSDYNFDQDGVTAPNDDLNKRKIAYRHRIIAQRYKQGLTGVFDRDAMALWNALYNTTDEFTDRWLSSARSLLKDCSVGKEDSTSLTTTDGGNSAINTSDRQHINVLVTSGSLIPSLVKCLLFQLDSLLPHENIYSSLDVGKLKCFQLVKERFNKPNTRFCVIGDGWEECHAAQIMQWPFVKIDLPPDSSNRFPGLSLKTVGYYFDVVYGSPDADDDDK